MMSRTSPPFPTENEKSMSEKVMDVKDKLAAHIRGHKRDYVIGGTCLLIGGMTGGMVMVRRPQMMAMNKINGPAWKPTQIMQLILPALGDPGNVVQAVETGTIYASQGQVARELGVDPSLVSRHLAGLIPDVKGLHLKVLGKAGSPLAE